MPQRFNVPMGTSPYSPPTNGGVEPGEDDRLIYAKDSQGNRLPDFSHVGYHAGEKAIPNATVVETLTPVEGDNTGAIQAAIDRAGAREPGTDGLRGAVLLKRGVYRVAGSLHIRHSGVVLRGEGRGTEGTVLVAAGYDKPEHQRDLIIVGNDGDVVLKEQSKRLITDSYVPVGARSFCVESAAGYRAGDRIVLYRPSTAAWISSIGMDRIQSKFKEVNGKNVDVVKQWKPGQYDFRFERKIIAIDENRIAVDVPLMHSLDARYGGGVIYHYDTPGRVFEIGIEDMSLISEFGEPAPENPYGDPEKDKESEQHGWHAILLGLNSENTWVQRVSANYFGRSLVNAQGLRATVQDCVNLGHVSEITGGRRYSFVTTGQMDLFHRCVAFRGRHEFVSNARTPGQNAFVDCLGVECVAVSGCGPHHRYSIGVLFDNVKSESQMESTDYGWRGSGHGWGGAQIAFYNCVAPKFFVTAPPGAACWVIGDRKAVEPDSKLAEPRSLYLKQLEERLGKRAYERATIKAQRDGTIYEWLKEQLDAQMEAHQ